MLIPKASIADAIVFAVYIPPQAPQPGHERPSTSLNSDGLIFPALYLPTASKTLTILRSLFSYRPGRIVPPYNVIPMTLFRANGISDAGIVLSHPDNAIVPSA